MALKFNGCVKCITDNFVVQKVSYGFIKEVVRTTYLYHVINEVGICIFKLLRYLMINLPLWDILKHKKLFEETFFLEKLCTVYGSLLAVYHQILEAFAQSNLDCYVILYVNGLNKLK